MKTGYTEKLKLLLMCKIQELKNFKSEIYDPIIKSHVTLNRNQKYVWATE